MWDIFLKLYLAVNLATHFQDLLHLKLTSFFGLSLFELEKILEKWNLYIKIYLEW